MSESDSILKSTFESFFKDYAQEAIDNKLENQGEKQLIG